MFWSGFGAVTVLNRSHMTFNKLFFTACDLLTLLATCWPSMRPVDTACELLTGCRRPHASQHVTSRGKSTVCDLLMVHATCWPSMRPVDGACDPLWARPDMESSESLLTLIPAALLYIRGLFSTEKGFCDWILRARVQSRRCLHLGAWDSRGSRART